jgi:type II secretory pathway pseudopilin PulG
MAITIIGIAATAVLGALATSVTASGQHRSIASVDTVLKSYAENAKYQIELKASPLFSNAACAAPSTYSSANLGWTAPTGYSTYVVGITSVEPWNATSKQFDSTGSCTNGLERLTIVATAPTGVSDTLQIVVRNPAYNTADAAL